MRRGLRNYWGYNSIGYFAPHAGLRRHRHPAAAGRRVQADGAGAARGGHRGDPRRRLQPHRGGAASWARRCPCAASTTAATTGWPDDARRYADYTGCGNTLHVVQPAGAAADHRLAALLGAPRWAWTASASTWRPRWPARMHDVDMLSPFLAVIAQDPVLRRVKLIAEPWDVGIGRLPGRRLPAAVDGVERPLPRHRARLLARRASPTCATWATGCPAPATCTPGAAAARTPRSTSSPRTTASPCATWSRYERKHNEANGEDNRDGTDDNRSWNCGAEGETDDPDVTRAAPPPAAQPADHPAAVHRRADAGRRRRDGPHPGRQQQRLLPGQRDQLARLVAAGGPRWRPLADLAARLHRAAPRPPGAAPPGVLLRPAAPAGRPARTWPGSPRTGAEMAEQDWYAPGRHAGHVPLRDATSRSATPRGVRSSTTASSPCCTPPPTHRPFTLPGPPWARAYELLVDTSGRSSRGRRNRRTRPAARSRWPGGRCCCSGRCRAEARAAAARGRRRWAAGPARGRLRPARGGAARNGGRGAGREKPHERCQ